MTGTGTEWRRHGAITVGVLALLIGSLAAGVPGAPAGIAAASEHNPPEAALTLSPNPAHPDEPVVVDATNSTDPDGGAVTCAFDLDGDGQFDAERSDCLVETTVGETGAVELTVRVTDDSGRSDEATAGLRVVENTAPTAEFTVDPAHPDRGETVRLDASTASDPDGTIEAYRWDIEGDGEPDRADGPTTEAVFESAGEFAVTLTVVDDDGATAAASTTVVVTGDTPAEGTAEPSVQVRRTVIRTVLVTPTPAAVGERPAGLAPAVAAVGGLDAWLLALVGLLLAGGVAATARRRIAVPDRARSLARRLKRRLTPRKIAARIVRSGVKKAFRKAGELVERGGEWSGNGIRRVGDVVERVTKRVGETLKRWGA